MQILATKRAFMVWSEDRLMDVTVGGFGDISKNLILFTGL